MIQLKNGQLSQDPRLDRVPTVDSRNNDYPIRALLSPSLEPRSYTWRCPVHLNQGSEGACVGFAWAQELAARPVAVPTVDGTFARQIYREAQELDEWPGHDYEGTSTLGGAKAVQARGFLEEYRWAFDLHDLVMAIGHHGPGVMGINWYDSMFNTGEDGFIRVSADASVAGGHDILVIGVSLRREAFRLHNSWGMGWGEDGEAWISFADVNRLVFHEDGDACIPVRRARG